MVFNPAQDPLAGLALERPKRTGSDYRALWKKAIHQQILLLRMETENQRLEGEEALGRTPHSPV